MEIANCRDEQEFVLKAVTTQLRSVKKQSHAAIQIKKWIEDAGWDEDEILEDFEEFCKKLNREQFISETK